MPERRRPRTLDDVVAEFTRRVDDAAYEQLSKLWPVTVTSRVDTAVDHLGNVTTRYEGPVTYKGGKP